MKVEPFLKSLKRLPSAEKERVREFWMNSDMNGINQVFRRHAAKTPGGVREFQNVRNALEDMYDLARENGRSILPKGIFAPNRSRLRGNEGASRHKDPLQKSD